MTGHRNLGLPRLHQAVRHAEEEDIARRTHRVGTPPRLAVNALNLIRRSGIEPTAAHEALAVLIESGWKPKKPANPEEARR